MYKTTENNIQQNELKMKRITRKKIVDSGESVRVYSNLFNEKLNEFSLNSNKHAFIALE